MEALPDLSKLGDADLDTLIEDLERRESEVSYERRMLQGKIDILRAERVARKRGKSDEELANVDVARLSEILSGKASPERSEPRLLLRVRLPELRGRQLLRALRRALEHEGADVENTLSYTPEQLAEESATGVEGIEGPALVVRSGGGRSGRGLRAAGRPHDHRSLS